MTNDEQVVFTAKNFVIAILRSGKANGESLGELYEISSGNTQVLLNHLKAINSITSDAIKILGGNNEKNTLL